VKHFTCSEAKHQVWKGYNNRKKNSVSIRLLCWLLCM
jgi:hypothetical protein